MLTLAELVKQRRLDDNLSLKRLAEVTGVEYVTLWKIEKKGYVKLSFNTISRLCEWLDLTPKQLREYMDVQER